MPQGRYGLYSYRPATIYDLVAAIAGKHESFIGYQQTADMIARWCKCPAPRVSRELLPSLIGGDILFVVRLNYRIADPTTKGVPVSESISDWEIAKITYIGERFSREEI